MSGEKNDTDFLLKNLMDNMTDMIYFKDVDSRFILMNQAAAQWHGFKHPDDVIGTTDFDRYTEHVAQGMFDAEQAIIQSGKPLVGIEEKEILNDGREAWVSTTKMPLRDPEGKVVGTIGVSRDITVHKEAELHAANLAAQIKQIKEEMEEEVCMAAELQKTFFPRSYPIFPKNANPSDSAVQFHHHYHASGMVSGDFCSIRRLSETECGILQCDVMGHGVRAALVTALIYAMVEELTLQEIDPGNFLSHMNELLLPILRQEDTFLYATACYTVFDAATGRLQVANAGHPVPLHLKNKGKDADWLLTDLSLRGPALAICEGTEYQMVKVQLQPGDSVVMYTDGLYEVIGSGNEEFGEQRLLEATRRHPGLGLTELFPAMINEARHYSADGTFDDDVCLVGFSFVKQLDL
jgi:sigma-B regulation protein RsbU (phosphoserine phosphatase)